jgi:fructokinase
VEVICIGEALVDMLPSVPGRVRDVEAWTRCPGGAPANVAIGLARLGAKVALVGVVGNDEFGHFLCERLATEGVDVSHLRRTDEGRTGLAFVSLTSSGERSFCFYRTQSAEGFFDQRDVDAPFLTQSRFVHVGTNSLIKPGSRAAILDAIAAARAGGAFISCDPNLRLSMWPDPSELKAIIGKILPNCTVVKMSHEETSFVLDTEDVETALVALQRLGVRIPVVTLAEKGAAFLWEGKVHMVPAPSVRVVDTTGAGDGFTAGLLYRLSRTDLTTLTLAELTRAVTLGCNIGSTVVQALGAVTGLPKRKEVESWLSAS